MLGGRLDGLLLLDGLLGSLLGSSLRRSRSLSSLEVDFSTTTAMISGERSIAVGALVVHILERGDQVGDTTEADNAAGKQGHEMGETTGFVADSGHDTLVAVGALDGGRLGSEAHKRHTVGIRSDSILSAKAGGLVLRGTICVGLAVGLSLGLNLGLGLLLVDRRGNALLVLNGLAWLRDNLTGGLGGDVTHLVLGAGGLNLGIHCEGEAIRGVGLLKGASSGEERLAYKFRN